jgi:Trk K+ transport system NAD-binding subunit
VRLLELQKEGLEVVEVQIEKDSPVSGERVGGIRLPGGSRLISVFRHGRTELVEPETVMRPGDQVLAVVATESALELRRALLGAPK